MLIQKVLWYRTMLVLLPSKEAVRLWPSRNPHTTYSEVSACYCFEFHFPFSNDIEILMNWNDAVQI